MTNGHDVPEHHKAISWPRALGSGLAIVIVGFLAVVYLPDMIVGQSSGTRDQRVYLAAGLSVVAVIVLAWVLRRLQSRRLI